MRLYEDGYTYDDGGYVSDEIEDVCCDNCQADIPDEWIYTEQCSDCDGYEVDNPNDLQWSDVVVPLSDEASAVRRSRRGDLNL